MPPGRSWAKSGWNWSCPGGISGSAAATGRSSASCASCPGPWSSLRYEAFRLRWWWTPGSRCRRCATGAADQDRPEGFREAVERISLEHLLVGSAITGSPAGSWGGGIAGGPGTSSGAGPGSTDSYLFSGGDPRTPVAVLVDPPARQPDGAIVAEYGRRPVVAVVDTGVRAHPWLDVAPDGAGGYTMPGRQLRHGRQRHPGCHPRRRGGGQWQRRVAAGDLGRLG